MAARAVVDVALAGNDWPDALERQQQESDEQVAMCALGYAAAVLAMTDDEFELRSRWARVAYGALVRAAAALRDAVRVDAHVPSGGERRPRRRVRLREI